MKTKRVEAHSVGVKREVARARKALMQLLREGPLRVGPNAIAQAAAMSDADVLALKYELRGFLRSIADANAKVGVN